MMMIIIIYLRKMSGRASISNKSLFDFINKIAIREELAKPNLDQDIVDCSQCLNDNMKELNEDKYEIIEKVLCLFSKYIKKGH